MNPSNVTESFIGLCENSGSSLDALMSAFRKAIEELGFRYFAFCSHVNLFNPSPYAINLHNYPTDWVRHFNTSKYYAIDPVLKRAERAIYPFFWDSTFKGNEISARQRAILSEAAAFGLAHGYTVPLTVPWTPAALRASCSVIPGASAVDKDHYLAVQLIAFYLHSAISTGYAPKSQTTCAKLTDRERECLILAATGMTDQEIANALGMAVTTAHSHIGNSMLRFGANRRIRAVMCAVISGEISLDELANRCHVSDTTQHAVVHPNHRRLILRKGPASPPPSCNSPTLIRK